MGHAHWLPRHANASAAMCMSCACHATEQFANNPLGAPVHLAADKQQYPQMGGDSQKLQCAVLSVQPGQVQCLHKDHGSADSWPRGVGKGSRASCSRVTRACSFSCSSSGSDMNLHACLRCMWEGQQHGSADVRHGHACQRSSSCRELVKGCSSTHSHEHDMAAIPGNPCVCLCCCVKGHMIICALKPQPRW
jgi:hypothetical protein